MRNNGEISLAEERLGGHCMLLSTRDVGCSLPQGSLLPSAILAPEGNRNVLTKLNKSNILVYILQQGVLTVFLLMGLEKAVYAPFHLLLSSVIHAHIRIHLTLPLLVH